MANSDKNIVITPNVGSATAQPNIVYTGQNNAPITLRVADDGTLSWEASTGRLMSATTSQNGTLFSINDASGLPIFEVTNTASIIAYAPITGAGGAQLMNDISGQADGSRSVFDIKNEQTIVSSTYITDSKDVEVVVNGQQLTPYTQPQPGAWLSAFDSYSSKMFRVRENRLIIYNAPDVGSQISVTVKKTAATRQRQRYPFRPATIALGD
jgi:hypothetical protein